LNHHNFIAEAQSRSLPEWSLLYLGASQYHWEGLEYRGGYYLADRTYGRFAYGIADHMFEELVDTWMQLGAPGDGYLAYDIQKRYYGKCFVCYPNLCVANVTASDIRSGKSQAEQAVKLHWDMTLYS